MGTSEVIIALSASGILLGLLLVYYVISGDFR